MCSHLRAGFCDPDDIKLLAPKILPHRIVINPAARLTEITQVKIVNEILVSLPIPGADMDGEAQ